MYVNYIAIIKANLHEVKLLLNVIDTTFFLHFFVLALKIMLLIH